MGDFSVEKAQCVEKGVRRNNKHKACRLVARLLEESFILNKPKEFI